MVKVEDLQQFGQQQYESAIASATSMQQNCQVLADVVGDFTKRTMEEGTAYVGKLSSVKSIDAAIALQSDYARSTYEAFVNESKKITDLYADFARQACKPFEGFGGKAGR